MTARLSHRSLVVALAAAIAASALASPAAAERARGSVTGLGLRAKARQALLRRLPYPRQESVGEIGTGWTETFIGGSPEAEARHFAALAKKIVAVGATHARGGKSDRPFHAKPHLGVDNATFTVDPDLDPRFVSKVFAPGRVIDKVVMRFSNASGHRTASDSQKGLHGVGIHMETGDDDPTLTGEVGQFDLLLTNANPAHVRDADQFAAFGLGMAQLDLARDRSADPLARVRAAASGARELATGLGPRDTARTFRTLARQTRRPVESVLAETYHGRSPNKFGVSRASGRPYGGKYRLRALDPRAAAIAADGDPDRLGKEAAASLREGPARFALEFQPFVDARRTPLDDASIEWEEGDSPFIRVGTYVIPQQDVAAMSRARVARIEGMAFNPGNVPKEYGPASAMGRGRLPAYKEAAAAAGRPAQP